MDPAARLLLPAGSPGPAGSSSAASDSPDSVPGNTDCVNPRDRLRAAGRRVTDPAEALAQEVTERVVDLLLNALDVNELATRIDLNAVLGRVDVDAILKKVDVDALLDRVDVDALLDRVNVDALLDRVNVDALLDRVNVNALLDRVNVNALLDRVEVKPLLDRVDVNDLLEQVDMDALVERTDLGAVIARSSGGMTTEALDAVRSQAVGLDQFVDRWVRRVLRPRHPWPAAPAALLPMQAEP